MTNGETGPEMHVGVRWIKNPDGTESPDFSHAARMPGPEAKELHERIERTIKEQKREFAQSLRIDTKEAPEGSTAFVWYSLRNAIYMHEKRMRDLSSKHQLTIEEKRRCELNIKKYGREQDIISALQREGTKCENKDAKNVIEILQQWISKWETMKDKAMYYPIVISPETAKGTLDAAHDLLDRLIREASKN